MSEFDERVQANMDVVLEEVCAELPKGAIMKAASSSLNTSFGVQDAAKRRWAILCTPRAVLLFI
jgi:hypothetical protein